MPPHWECMGHSHDHADHEDDLGLSLRPQVDLPAVRCLNEEIPNSGRAVIKLHEDRLTAEPSLKSQPDDPELLLHVPFSEGVMIRSVSIRSVDRGGGDGDDDVAFPPRNVKFFVNREDLDFETARELDPDASIELVPPHHFVEGSVDYPLRPAGRFQNVTHLTIFFVDNYGAEAEDDDELSTVVTYVGFKGRGTSQKRVAVDTVYESRPMPKDHKAREEFGNQQLL